MALISETLIDNTSRCEHISQTVNRGTIARQSLTGRWRWYLPLKHFKLIVGQLDLRIAILGKARIVLIMLGWAEAIS